MKIEFHELADNISNIKFVVIQARYCGKWIFVRHKDRRSWEVPGGHIELNEPIIEAARRELWEESGALEFELTSICDYAVNRDGIKSFGRLYFAEVEVLGDLPEHEIVEITFREELPTCLTYEGIQSQLFEKVKQKVIADIDL